MLGRLRTQDHGHFVDAEKEGLHLSWIGLMKSNENVVPRVFGADSVADGIQPGKMCNSCCKWFSPRRLRARDLPGLRLCVQDGAQVDGAGG